MEGKALLRISVQPIGNLPLLGQVEKFPVSSAGLGTVVVTVTFFSIEDFSSDFAK